MKARTNRTTTCTDCGYVHQETHCAACWTMRARIRAMMKAKAEGKSYRPRSSIYEKFLPAAYAAYKKRIAGRTAKGLGIPGPKKKATAG